MVRRKPLFRIGYRGGRQHLQESRRHVRVRHRRRCGAACIATHPKRQGWRPVPLGTLLRRHGLAKTTHEEELNCARRPLTNFLHLTMR